MKYIKLFENITTDEIVVTTVDFTGGGDGVYACYVDGELEFYGDYYHDKINDRIIGFILGLKWIKENWVYPLTVKEETLKCTNQTMIEEISENGDVPPKKLKDIN